MSIILNIIVVALVLLIAYWWMDQGFFSALLHLAAVIVAGALALAFWEPLAISVLLSGGGFDSYAMGLSLGGLFAIILLILRATSDSVIRSNIMIPTTPDKLLGATMGLCAGILTIGFTLSAIGLMQGPHEMMGYKGFARQRGQAGIMAATGPALWVPVDKWTTDFYEWLSISTMHPDIGGAPLKHYYPELYKMPSLLRDNFNGGEGQVSMPSDAVDVTQLRKIDGSNFWVVNTNFKSNARDFGRQLVLSSSQIRLVGEPDGTKKPSIIYPIMWLQPTPQSDQPWSFNFDDPTNYATSIPGRDEAQMGFIFEAPDGFKPNYMQVRGTRFDLPASSTVAAAAASAMLAGTSAKDMRQLGQPIDAVVEISDKVARFRANVNRIPGSMSLTENNRFESGFLRLPRRSETKTSRALQASRFAAPPGTQIVQVTISTSSPAWLGGQVQERVTPADEISLLDSMGHKYHPIGYYFLFGNEIEIKLDPQYGLRTVPELPQLSMSQPDQILTLVFQVTGGVKLTSLRVGHTLVGSMDVEVPPAF